MLRTCKMCGAVFDAIGAMKYCSTQCRDQSRWFKEHPGRSEDGMYRAVCPWCKQEFASTRKRVFCSDRCLKESTNQIAKDRRRENINPDELVCLRCGKPIAFERKGKLGKFCSKECRKKHKNPGEPNILTDDMLREKAEARLTNLEYVEKQPGTDKIIFRCKICGGTFKHTSQVLRRAKFKGECPICKRLEKKEIDAQRARRVLNNKIVRALHVRQERLKDEANRVRECLICGKTFRSIWGQSCCSDECIEKRAKQAKHAYSKRRRAIMKNEANAANNAENLTWQSIFEEERGVCYLCGEACNSNDYEIIGDAFIVGAKYPSIDHVTALANGGTHTRDNIRLAHFECNRIKGAN